MPGRTAQELVELTTAPTESHAGIIRSVLTDAGIESWTQKAPGIDYFGLGTLGFSVTTITVRAEDAERARAALDANRQDSVDLDWSDVNVGEPEDEVAARIAARPEHSPIEQPAPLASWFPIKETLGWIILIGLAGSLSPWYVPTLMFLFAVIHLGWTARVARRAARSKQPPHHAGT
ncbi:MAG: hypothetical protein JNK58_09695 [Phycisphaerae bacterium]|nr:hypothetical protein [Phycisphaerae bacterium]